MHDEMSTKEGINLMSIFVSTFFVSGLIIFLVRFFASFESTLLVGICLVTAVIATIGTGIENTITNNVHNQIVRFRAQAQGFLTDMYAEMIKDKK